MDDSVVIGHIKNKQVSGSCHFFVQSDQFCDGDKLESFFLQLGYERADAAHIDRPGVKKEDGTVLNPGQRFGGVGLTDIPVYNVLKTGQLENIVGVCNSSIGIFNVAIGSCPF